MVPFSVLSRGLLRSSLGKQCVRLTTVRNITMSPQSSIPSLKKFLLFTMPIPIIGTIYCAYYYFVNENVITKETESAVLNQKFKPKIISFKPDTKITKVVPGARDDTGLKITLYQFTSCPFCCKVRAFLNYYGLPYEIVEVNPVFKQQLSWSIRKKVPSVLIQVDGGYLHLTDSSLIMSAIRTYLLKKGQDMKEIAKNYPVVDMYDDSESQICNKYFLMYEEAGANLNTELIKEEKKWRKWADDSLVHMLSPNVYKTYAEATETFNWFAKVGDWDNIFSSWEKSMIIAVGSTIMWAIGKRLKKRHNIVDERESLYEDCRKWMKAVKAKKTTFLGGNTPNLADITVYGVLSSIEGLGAFQDLLKNTNIGEWYYPMQDVINNRLGKSEIFV